MVIREQHYFGPSFDENYWLIPEIYKSYDLSNESMLDIVVRVRRKEKRPFFSARKLERIEEEINTIGLYSEEGYHCNKCGIGGDSDNICLLKCSGCKRARYCSEACNKKAWPEHKLNYKKKWRVKTISIETEDCEVPQEKNQSM